MKPTTIEASTARESTTDSSLLPTVTLTYDGDISDKDSETTTLTYLGDVEEVEDHLKKQEMMHPDVCQGNFDAVTSLRNEVFIFKGLVSIKSKYNTVFENHSKSHNQHCERSELRLHFEWTKVH